MPNFRDLEIWKDGMELVKKVYVAVAEMPKAVDSYLSVTLQCLHSICKEIRLKTQHLKPKAQYPTKI